MSWIQPVIQPVRVESKYRHLGRKPKVIRSLHRKIIALHTKGKAQAVIMKKLSISRTTVWKHIHGHIKNK